MPISRFSAVSGLIAAFALSACNSMSPENFVSAPMTPDPVVEPDPPEVRLVAAIERQGCVLTADNVEAVLLDANLTQADVAEITPRLADAGRVEVAGSGAIRVNTEACA